MAKGITERQLQVLLQVYVADADGWNPDDIWDRGGVAVSRRLGKMGLIEATGDAEEPGYVLTDAGRTALALDTSKSPKRLRTAVQRGLAWLGAEVAAWDILIGRQLPVIRLDEGEADYRGCSFALRANDNSDADVMGFLRAMGVAHVDEELRWEALARFVTELGFPVEAEGRCEQGVIGFWPAEED